MTDATAYPLCWPAGKPRTSNRQSSNFGTNSWAADKRVTLSRAVSELLREIELLGGINEIISSNLKLRQDGLPYSNQRTPDDPGIAVYFEMWDGRAHKPVCMACDRWDKQACNVWSITKSINALRGLERWGGGDMVQAAFTGFMALPSPESSPWWATLGYYSEANALESDFEARAKSLMQKFHPDKSDGDEWAFKQVVKARDAGRSLAA